MSVNVRGQVDYEIKISEDDRFTWEVTEVNYYNFEKVFGFEPNVEKGDKTTREIVDIRKTVDGYDLTIKFWDYKADMEKSGDTIYDDIPKDPADYEDNIFILTPVEDYLEEADKDLPSEYVVEGAKVTRREKEYTMIKEYDTIRGVLLSETYIDDDGIVLIKVEGIFATIPTAGWEYITGFIALTTIGIIVVMIKKKKFNIKSS